MKKIFPALARLSPLIFLVLSLLFKMLLENIQQLQSWYYHSVFLSVRHFQDYVFNRIPIAGLYYLPLLILVLQVYFLPKPSNLRKWPSLKRSLRRSINMWSVVALLFLWLWGYNYSIDHFPAKNNDQNDQNNALLNAYERVMYRAAGERDLLPSTQPITLLDSKISDSRIEEAVRNVLSHYQMHVNHQVPLRKIQPKGVLRRLGISGIYNPFTGEANVDTGLDPLNEIFTTAHELAHAYGIAGEAEANFTAYLACLSINDPMAQYAAHYVLWRYLAFEVIMQYPLEKTAGLPEIPVLLQQDRQAIRELSYQFPEIFPDLSSAVNDAYLKTQGIESGVRNYSEFIQLVLQKEPELLKPVSR